MDDCEETNEVSNNDISCGRVIFREADLAYLLVDKERMFPLAELLASLFSNTARTTLFTRMEKIDTRRHFCDAEEIKLLKTVNGIHGSSAICTLIPEADVEKYCGVYVDRTIDLKLFAKGKRTRKLTAKDKVNCKSKVARARKSTIKDNDEQNQIVSNSSLGSDKVTKTNSLKRKNRLAKCKQRDKVEARVKVSKEAGLKSLMPSECLARETPCSPTLSEHVTNGTQTVSLLSDSVVKPRKPKRKAKDFSKEDDCRDHIEQSKRPRSTNEEVSTLFPTPTTSQEDGFVVNSDGNFIAGARSSSSTENIENSNSSSLAQCLTNASSEILFSDSSSNDSGFASTTLSLAPCSPSVGSSTAKADKSNEKATPKKITLTFSPKLNKSKTPTKVRLEQEGLDFKNPNKPVPSPPALVLKRQNNTWQVETKPEIAESKAKTGRKISKTAKKLKWTTTRNSEHHILLENGVLCEQKFLKKRKRQNKSVSDKAGNGTVHEEGARNVVKKKRVRRKQNKSILPCSTITTMNAESNINLNYKKKGLTRKTATKKGKKTANLRADLPSREIKEARSSKSLIAMTTTSTKLSSVTNTASSKKIGNCVKANKNFKFMNLFSAFPFLSERDGDLCPTFSMVVPENIRKPSVHKMGKWHLGGSVVDHDSQKQL